MNLRRRTCPECGQDVVFDGERAAVAPPARCDDCAGHLLNVSPRSPGQTFKPPDGAFDGPRRWRPGEDDGNAGACA